MAVEIERKFLVRGDQWRSLSVGVVYRQGYITTTPEKTVRVRIAGNQGYLTIKGASEGYQRAEFEYLIPIEDAEQMLSSLCVGPLIEKKRYKIPIGDLIWEVDEFFGDNQGLILAEVELNSPEQAVELPEWIGEEVSHDYRYYNANLTKFPYTQWAYQVRTTIMEFQTQVQRECYEQVAIWMEEMFTQYPWEKLDDPGFGLFLGSAWVEVRIYPWHEDAVIETRSLVVQGAEITPELMQFLLLTNSQMRFGGFAIDDHDNICLSHTIVGSTCDPGELESSVLSVLETADDFDDQIIQKWGGKRALDIVP
ncbi:MULTISPECIES: CYTH domain-containing protein [Limnospira]|uniref:CYTH domain-containing protein n=1 Tax=Limnospira TaxID=2596745 RepID=UPI00028043A8|nr:adenylate cyclase [Arthrospira platensis C1]UWU49017.1 CYTH domain-containing protein [Arthrospira platensis C1]